jgi:hypothetical protein
LCILSASLEAGKKRLEDALTGLSDEQCERAGATRSGSVVDFLFEIATKEFLALEVSDRLPGFPMNLLASADGRTRTATGPEKPAANKSVENLLAEFDVLRSAVIRRIEGWKCQPSSRTGENPPYGMIGGTVETSASFEARYAPLSYPTGGAISDGRPYRDSDST